MSKAITNICLGLTAAAGTAAFLKWQNQGIRVTKYKYSSDDLPQGFSGFRIAHISDFHNDRHLGKKVAMLTKAEKPDIIALTGDLFDCRKLNLDAGINLIQQLVKIAPVYYVRGNHEARIENTDDVTALLESMGVTVMENSKITLEKNGAAVTLMGAKDPRFYHSGKKGENGANQFRRRLSQLTENDSTFKLLLSHRPEFIHTYRNNNIDLALTGHAHGGQFGIPFTDYGVFVPNQGVFPPYAAGMKQMDNTTVVISRGIGNSGFPLRLFNRPEVVIIEFE